MVPFASHSGPWPPLRGISSLPRWHCFPSAIQEVFCCWNPGICSYYCMGSFSFKMNSFSPGLLGSETCYLRPHWKSNESKEMHPQAKRKASVGVTWPTPKARAILYLIYPYKDNGFITLGVISAWVISQSDLPLPTSPACHRKVKVICLYQIFAFTHYLHMSNICQLPSLSPPPLPTPREEIEKMRRAGHQS